jgi:hypothetical protein
MTEIRPKPRPHTPALAEKPCDHCDFETIEDRIWEAEQKAAATATLATLDTLQKWRIKRMNGMLKKDVYIGWNEETDFIESLRTAAQEERK